MKTLRKVTCVFAAITLIAVFSSCQSSPDVKEVLSKPETRNMIMDSIANNSTMSMEMMESMMKSKSGNMMMQGDGKMMGKMMGMMMENHDGMMKMMKENPAMMESMMSKMMEMCKSDSTMMSGMCKTMMGDKQMMGMMQDMMKDDKSMNMTGSEKKMDKMNDNNMNGMDHNKTEKK